MQLFLAKSSFSIAKNINLSQKRNNRSILTEEQKDINRGAVAALEAFRQKSWSILTEVKMTGLFRQKYRMTE